MSSRILTLKEVSERTRIPEATIRWFRHVQDGRGPKTFKLAGRVVALEDDVEAWIQAQYDAADKQVPA